MYIVPSLSYERGREIDGNASAVECARAATILVETTAYFELGDINKSCLDAEECRRLQVVTRQYSVNVTPY